MKKAILMAAICLMAGLAKAQTEANLKDSVRKYDDLNKYIQRLNLSTNNIYRRKYESVLTYWWKRLIVCQDSIASAQYKHYLSGRKSELEAKYKVKLP